MDMNCLWCIDGKILAKIIVMAGQTLTRVTNILICNQYTWNARVDVITEMVAVQLQLKLTFKSLVCFHKLSDIGHFRSTWSPGGMPPYQIWCFYTGKILHRDLPRVHKRGNNQVDDPLILYRYF